MKCEVCEHCVSLYGLVATEKPPPPDEEKYSRKYIYEQCSICMGRSAPLEVEASELKKARAIRVRNRGQDR